MGSLLAQIGRIAGFVGVLVCVIAVIWRALGNFGVLVGCFCLLVAQAEKR